MKRLTVTLPGHSYDILIAPGLLLQAGERIRAVCPQAGTLFVVTDTNVGPLYGEAVRQSLEKSGFRVALHTVPAGESSKNADQLSRLWEAMAHAGLTRTDAVIALGGGVVGDLAGFAAATILRGVDFVQIPTTLLALRSGRGDVDNASASLSCHDPNRRLTHKKYTLQICGHRFKKHLRISVCKV